MISRAAAWLVTGPLRVVLVPGWLLATVLAVSALPSIGRMEEPPTSIASAGGPHRESAEQREIRDFGFPVPTNIAVVQRDPHGLSTGAQRRVLERARAIDERHSPVDGIIGAVPILNSGGAFPGSREDGTTAVTLLLVKPDLGLYAQNALAQRYARTEVNRPDDALVGVTGAIPARAAQGDIIDSYLPWIEAATVLLIAVLIALRFRSLVAPVVTLLTGGIAYLVSSHILAWGAVHTGLGVPVELEPLLVVLVLAVTTDYSVFLLSGTREHLVSGESPVMAARLTAEEYIPILFTAASLVALSATCVGLSRLRFLQALGPALGVSVLISGLVALTFTPALLAALGPLAFWPRLRPRGDRPGVAYDARIGDPGRFRRAAARLHTLRPTAALVSIAVVAVLALCATGLAQLRVGISLVNDLPASNAAARAGTAAAKGFAPGIYSPTVVLLEGRGLDHEGERLGRLEDAIGRQRGIAGVVGPREELTQGAHGILVTTDGQAARIVVILADDPFGSAAIDTVNSLRERLPGLVHQAGLNLSWAGVGGDTATAAQTVAQLAHDTPLIAVAIAAVDLLLMAVLLRALVAPVYLLVASGLAAAAPLGLLVILFAHLGQPFQDFYVPLGVAVLLVSLGSDYNLFVVGRIWEEAGRRPIREAVREAAPRASRAIGTAALALSFSFALLAIVPLASFRAFAFAMAAGALIDSYLVRSHLVPSLVSLTGRWSLWPSPAPAAELRPPELA